MTSQDEARAWESVAAVEDPELPGLTIQDLGILRGVHSRDGQLTVTIAPTYSGCPALAVIATDVQRALGKAGFDHAIITLSLSPPWTSDWITETGRRKLHAAGIAPPGEAPTDLIVQIGTRPAAVPCPQCGCPDTVEQARFGATACRALRRCQQCDEPFDAMKPI